MMDGLFERIPHPHVGNRKAVGPATVDDQHDRSTTVARFNARLAVWITRGVGTMWCAFAFMAIALVSLPSAIKSGDPVIMVQWLSSVLLQLVLLSIILVGQNVSAAAADKRALDTYTDAEAILHEVVALHNHLVEQDKVLLDTVGLLRVAATHVITMGTGTTGTITNPWT